MAKTYVPTRFYSLSYADDGTLLLHNGRTGALGAVPAEQASVARDALKRSARHQEPLAGLLKDLAFGGFLIPEGTDEEQLVHQQYLEKYSEEKLGLILLPTEDCNFRCVYCYESFGIADDLLTTAIIASPKPIAFAPAMNPAMWRSRAVQRNLQTLMQDGHYIIPPDEAISVTSGEWDQGLGPSPESVLLHLQHLRMKDLRDGYWEEATSTKPLTPAQKKLQTLAAAAERRKAEDHGTTVPTGESR